MPRKTDEITAPAPSTAGRQMTANENRPAPSPSATEMIAEASAARAAMDEGRDTADDAAAATEKPGAGQADDTAPAGGSLPTMEELELARDDHRRKIADNQGDGKD